MAEEKKEEATDLMLFDHPSLPDEWSYSDSVNKMKRLIYKWRNMTRDVANELWVARENLAQVGNPNFTIGANASIDKTWSQYCEDIRQRVRSFAGPSWGFFACRYPWRGLRVLRIFFFFRNLGNDLGNDLGNAY